MVKNHSTLKHQVRILQRTTLNDAYFSAVSSLIAETGSITAMTSLVQSCSFSVVRDTLHAVSSSLV